MVVPWCSTRAGSARRLATGQARSRIHAGALQKALDEAGHAYEWKVAKGGIVKPWTWPSRTRDRAEVQALSGQQAVPILVLDNSAVVTGSTAIARWASDNAPEAAAAS